MIVKHMNKKVSKQFEQCIIHVRAAQAIKKTSSKYRSTYLNHVIVCKLKPCEELYALTEPFHQHYRCIDLLDIAYAWTNSLFTGTALM